MKDYRFLLVLLLGILVSATKSAAQTPTDKQLQAIEKYVAPLRKKVTDILETDKTGQYKTYKNDLEGIAKETDRAKRNDLVAKLERDHYAFIKKSYNSAVINHEEMRREYARILGHSKFTLGEFGDLQIDFTTPAAALPLRFDTEFSCPMEVNDHNENSGLAAFCVAQGGNCTMDVQCGAEIAGGCKAKTSLGDNFIIPAGTFTKINVSAQTDISYEGWAFALAGYGQINAKYGIRFRAPGIDKVMFTKELFAFAPIIWFAHLNGNANNFVSQASFNGNFPEGTTVTAQAQLEGFALSVPVLSLTLLYADTDNIDFIRLSASN